MKAKIEELGTNSKIKIIRESYKGIVGYTAGRSNKCPDCIYETCDT